MDKQWNAIPLELIPGQIVYVYIMVDDKFKKKMRKYYDFDIFQFKHTESEEEKISIHFKYDS